MESEWKSERKYFCLGKLLFQDSSEIQLIRSFVRFTVKQERKPSIDQTRVRDQSFQALDDGSGEKKFLHFFDASLHVTLCGK